MSEKRFYKVRHKASGLFFRPSGGMRDLNVSKQGKVYQRKPSLKIYGRVTLGFGRIGQTWFKARGDERDKEYTVPFLASEWELIEFVSSETVVPWEGK